MSLTAAACMRENLAQFPAAAQPILTKVISDPGFRGVVRPDALKAIGQALMCGVDDVLLLLVPFAQCYAIVPISGYPVGAVAEGTTTGAAYFGANMEYRGTALSATVHAEQSALTNAWLNGETGLNTIAITAAPCGYCRQFLYEITTASTLAVRTAKGVRMSLTDLLPHPFGPGDLPDEKPPLMSAEDHALTLETPSTDPLVLAALRAASKSYAPHTKGFAGVALETAGGAVHTGRYAENAAFNPSLPALESALTMWVFGGGSTDTLVRAVLVQAQSDSDQAEVTSDQADVTKAVLATVSKIKLEVYAAV
jgi:cytidine deaminase